MQVLVPLAHGAEEIEAVTIIDVLRRGGLDVVAAGLEPGPVTCSRGVVLVPDISLDDWQGDWPGAIVLPGGLDGAERLASDPRVEELARGVHGNGGVVAAICAAPIVLAGFGLLDDVAATCHPSVVDRMGPARVCDDAVCVDGSIITGRGPGASLEFALAVVEATQGRERAESVAAPM